jgi:CRP-like cAMP-binding protein
MREILQFCHTQLPQRVIPAATIVLAEGERVGVLYVLVEGTVEILKGDFLINTVSEPGTVFGEIAVLLDRTHTATVRTVDEARFYVADDPLAFLQSRPEIALGVARLLAKRLHAMTTYLADLKSQFDERGDHLSMIDEVLETLAHDPGEEHSPGSDRDPDPNVY